MPVLPPSFLVQATFSVNELSKWPKSASLSIWEQLTPLATLASLDSDTAPMAVRMGWHANGVVVGVEGAGKTVAPQVFDGDALNSDSVTVCFDMRDTKSIHRANRFCQRFRLLPSGTGKSGQGSIRQEPVPRSREDAPFRELKGAVAFKNTANGYQLLATIPAENLNGFDPVDSPKLGFFAQLHDIELGVVPFTGDPKLPAEADPSMWSTIELRRSK